MTRNVVLMDPAIELIAQIQRRFRPGMVRWIRKNPRHWKKLLQLEERVNHHATTQNRKMLEQVLGEYKAFFDEIIFFYENDGSFQRPRPIR
jgi:hypothetical protein